MVTERQVMNMLDLAAKMSSMELDDTEKSYYIKKLKGRMSGEEVVSALDDLIEKSRKPTLAAILAYERSGFDDAETAYAKAIASVTDESQTCLMNDAIMQAWGIAQPLYEEGMNYDASRAFKAAYEEAVRDQKAAGHIRPKWFLSMGTDKVQREGFIRQAAAEGLLGIEHAKTHLPHLTEEQLTNPRIAVQTPTIARIAKTVESDDLPEKDVEAGKQALAELKSMMEAMA